MLRVRLPWTTSGFQSRTDSLKSMDSGFVILLAKFGHSVLLGAFNNLETSYNINVRPIYFSSTPNLEN